jgi:hypothetical protein
LKPKPKRADIVIIGGGLSGISSAIAASREGATVALVEKLDEWGGSIGEFTQMPVDSPSTSNEIFFRESGIFEEIISHLRLDNQEGTYAGQSRALTTLLKSEPKISTFLGYHCLSATLSPDQDRIETCTAINLQEGNEVLFRAKYFIDASNRGHLAKLAGVPGETGVNSIPDTQGHHKTIFRSAALVEIDKSTKPNHFCCPEWINIKWEKNSISARTAWMESLERHLCGFHHLEWISEDSAVPNASELCWAAWDYLKNRSPLKDLAKGLLVKRVIPLPAPKSNFRGSGDYTLTKKDLLSGRAHSDSVAVGRSPLCENNSLIYSSTGKFALSKAFEIPLRCLYSKKVRNLLWTGGHASCDAVTSLNLSHPPTAAQMGVATGFCAAQCIAQKRLPRTLAKEGYIEKIREQLAQKNHRTSILPFADKANLAVRATALASTTWSARNIEELPTEDGIETTACLVQFPIITDKLETVRFLVSCLGPQSFDVRLMAGSNENKNIPGTCLEVDSVKVDKPGKQWIEFNFNTQLPSKSWYFLEIRSVQNFCLIEARNAPVGFNVQYPRKLSKVDGENQYSNYCPIPNYDPSPHNCPVMEIIPNQNIYQANEVITDSSRPYKIPGLWISRPTTFSYPEFIELSWTTPISVSRIDLFFDPSFGYNSFPHPQPTKCGSSISLIKDYKIYSTDPSGKSSCLIEVQENLSAHRSHLFEDQPIKSIELEILSTHGLDRAQVFRIALYE